MKLQELRLGNYYNWVAEGKKYPMKVDSKDFTNENYKNFEPVPITEEWLLKFGFIKSDLDGDNAWLNLRYRFLNFASDESVNFEKVYLTVNKMDIICSYVHELQNLYFALTQTELHAN